MRTDEIQVFVDGTINYFSTVSIRGAQVGSPYLLEDLDDSIFEYTGIIGVTGMYSGNILFSAPKIMMQELLEEYDSGEIRPELLLDLVGEVANTLSGNARQTLGPNFNISPPVLSTGSIGEISIAKGLQTYCIPIVWDGQRSNLILAVS